jgi:group I intron endonuclease
MLNNISIFKLILNDAPQPWQLGFQDTAAPGFSGIVELHNTIFFYLVIICVSVFWLLGSIVYHYSSNNNPIIHKYLNHGINVPIQKCFKFKTKILKNNLYYSIRSYTTLPTNQLENSEINYIKVYENAFDMRKNILNENKGKSGIYMLTNKLTNDIYIGQSIDLSNRFKKYFTLSPCSYLNKGKNYIKSKNSLIISRALIKYGYSNFSVTILEYCDKSDLLVKEQYYLDKLNPQYNILKIAGSSLNHKHTEETKAKISQSLKGAAYADIKEKSALFGTFLSAHTEETKKLMSLKKQGSEGENNSFFKKTHKETTIELMRQKALGRIHSESTKLKISAVRGKPVYIYEKLNSEEFNLIGSFISARRAGKFLDISCSTVIRYMNSGEIFKNRYKFSSK